MNWSRFFATITIVAVLVFGGMYWKGCGPFTGSAAHQNTTTNNNDAGRADGEHADGSEDGGDAGAPVDANTRTPTPAADSGTAPTPRPTPAVDAGSTASPTPAADAGTTASPAADAAVAQPAAAGTVTGTVPQGYVCPTGRTCYGAGSWPGQRCDSVAPFVNDHLCPVRMRRYRDYSGAIANPSDDTSMIGVSAGPNAYLDCSMIAAVNGRRTIPPSEFNVGSYIDDASRCVWVAAQ